MSGIIKYLDNKDLSRRQLLSSAGKVAAGLAVVSAGGLGIVSVADAAKGAAYPWPYRKLDSKHVARLAYEDWYGNFCAHAVAYSIIQSLREKVGKPYTDFPTEVIRWGHGGGVGWGTVCGTLAGAGVAAALVAGKKDGDNIINDVFHYYAATELPIYKPAKPKATFKTVSTSNSPLCHVSVGTWMKKEGVKFFTPQRKDRCARLSADIAVETVRLLNLWADGKYKPAHKKMAKLHGMPTQGNCTDCHGK